MNLAVKSVKMSYEKSFIAVGYETLNTPKAESTSFTHDINLVYFFGYPLNPLTHPTNKKKTRTRVKTRKNNFLIEEKKSVHM